MNLTILGVIAVDMAEIKTARKMIQRLIARASLRWGRISQSEIDREAHALIWNEGDNAERVAIQLVQRAQWAKGNSDAPQRAARVLRAVRRYRKQNKH